MSSQTSSDRFGPLSTHNVGKPAHLSVKLTKENLLTGFNTYGYDGHQWFGCAFIQGKRLQFTTAMPLTTMLDVSDIDRSDAGSKVSEVMEHANRPRVASHARALREYLLTTACKEEKFILPAFTFNYGDEHSTPEDAPEAVLVIYASEGDNSTNGWPALFQLPNATKLDTTDGAHRRGEIEAILKDSSLTKDQKENLRRNAVDVKIVFERKRVDAHQDFADCGKAKPITKSMITTFDVREIRNNRTVKLVHDVAFLQHYVDATASNVNLSANSAKIWSMTSVRGFVAHIQDHYPPASTANESQVEDSLDEKLNGAAEFFAAVIDHLPQLKTLALAVGKPKAEDMVSPGAFRNKRGGDIMLRGVGMSILARAFVYAKEHGIKFDEVAKRLGKVDWHLLDCERSDLPLTDTQDGRNEFPGAVRRHLIDTWASMIVIGESRYRIGSSNDEANQAWARILAAHFEPIAKAA